MLKNFCKKNWALILIFSIIVFLIFFATGHTLSEKFSSTPLPWEYYVLGAWGATILLSYYIFPEINQEHMFLKINYTPNEIRVIQAGKGFALCSFLYFLFLGSLVGFGLVSYSKALIGLPLCVFGGLYCFYPQERLRRMKVKSFLPKPQALIDKVGKGQLFKTILNLSVTYLLRFYRGKLLFGLVQVIVLNIIVAIYVVNTKSDYNPLYFFVPFLWPLLGALDMNSETLSSLRGYISPSLLCSFFVDFLIWIFVLTTQWCLTTSVLLFFKVGNIGDYITFLALLPFILLFIITIKFKFLNSRFMRSFGFGVSLILPVVFPVILALLIKDFVNDTN